MPTHSATTLESARSGMCEHFDDRAADFVLSGPPRNPHGVQSSWQHGVRLFRHCELGHYPLTPQYSIAASA